MDLIGLCFFNHDCLRFLALNLSLREIKRKLKNELAQNERYFISYLFDLGLNL